MTYQAPPSLTKTRRAGCSAGAMPSRPVHPTWTSSCRCVVGPGRRESRDQSSTPLAPPLSRPPLQQLTSSGHAWPRRAEAARARARRAGESVGTTDGKSRVCNPARVRPQSWVSNAQQFSGLSLLPGDVYLLKTAAQWQAAGDRQGLSVGTGQITFDQLVASGVMTQSPQLQLYHLTAGLGCHGGCPWWASGPGGCMRPYHHACRQSPHGRLLVPHCCSGRQRARAPSAWAVAATTPASACWLRIVTKWLGWRALAQRCCLLRGQDRCRCSWPLMMGLHQLMQALTLNTHPNPNDNATSTTPSRG